jgi:hypothetical protein
MDQVPPCDGSPVGTPIARATVSCVLAIDGGDRLAQEWLALSNGYIPAIIKCAMRLSCIGAHGCCCWGVRHMLTCCFPGVWARRCRQMGTLHPQAQVCFSSSMQPLPTFLPFPSSDTLPLFPHISAARDRVHHHQLAAPHLVPAAPHPPFPASRNIRADHARPRRDRLCANG